MLKSDNQSNGRRSEHSPKERQLKMEHDQNGKNNGQILLIFANATAHPPQPLSNSINP
jgi:hypothetical protein